MNECIFYLEITRGGNPKKFFSKCLVLCGIEGGCSTFSFKDLYVTGVL
jgi:hypothetical protein